MFVSFGSPLSALVVVAAVAPLAAFVLAGRRAARVASALRLPPEPARRRLLAGGALAAVAALVAIAAAQPVITLERGVRVRTDAEAFAVFDTSRSMLASSGYGAPTRLERARRFAVRLRSRLAEIPFGIASMTDRTLPHLFPTADAEEFAATAQRAIGVDRPPPEQLFAQRATTMGALSAFSTQTFFGDVPHRLLVVLTDGESRPFVDASIGALFRRPPSIGAIFVRFWSGDERVYVDRGATEPEYAPDPRSARTIARLATVVGGRSFSEGQLDAAVRAARGMLGEGPLGAVRPQRRKIRLAPYVALAAFLPLSLLLWRRNL